MKYFVRMHIQAQHDGLLYGGYVGYEVENKLLMDKFSKIVLQSLQPGLKFIENTVDLKLTKDNRFSCYLTHGAKTIYIDGFIMDLKEIVRDGIQIWYV